MGTLLSWGSGIDDEPYEFKSELLWERVADKVMRIKNAEDEHFTTVTYSLEPYIGAYKFKYDRLYEPGNHLEKHGLKGIWNIPGELFRRKK